MNNLNSIESLKNMVSEMSRCTNRAYEIANMSATSIDNISALQNENNKLKKDLEEANNTIIQLNNKYNKDIESKNNEIKQKGEEITNLTKVSMIHTINKQLEEKTNYIKILEGMLERKNKQSSKELELELVPPVIEVEPEPDNSENRGNGEHNKGVEMVEAPEKTTYEFNPDTFEEVNGYELLIYKKQYYLRDLETSEVYSIMNDMPDKVVGLMNNKGKIKLH